MSKITKEKARNKIVGGSEEPIIDITNYNISLSLALNHYNHTLSFKEYKESVMDFADSVGISVSRSIPEVEFRSIGAVCRLILREQPVKVEHIQQAIDRIHKIQSDYEKLVKKPEQVIEKVVSTKPIIEESEIFLDFINSVTLEFVDNVLSGKKTDKTIDYFKSEYARANFNKGETAKIIKEFDRFIKQYSNVLVELAKTPVCEQLEEAYKGVPTTRIKKVINLLTELKAGMHVVVEITKVASTRRKKEKPALVQVKDMEYLKEFEGIKSVHPKDAIGKSEVWIYDTETRHLHVIRAVSGSKIAGNGSTFQNVDADKSFKKTLRKPTEILNSFINMVENKTRKNFKSLFDQLTTTEQKASNRMSESKIIIHVFN